MVDSVATTATADAAANKVATSKTKLSSDLNSFLTLLTSQLKNQDPLSPMDSTQFTQQLVQMTGVEQQLLTNDLLEKLVTNTGSGIQTSVSMLGREVRALNSDAKLTAGKAEWSYSLDREATDVTVEVLNEFGKVVQVVKPTENKAGDHSFTWNGKDRTDQQLPNGGTYTLRITAKDSAGATVPVTNFVKGIVTGVEQVDGKTLITINGVKVGWEKVTAISDPVKEPAPVPPTPETPEQAA